MSRRRSIRSQFGGAYEQYLILILFIVLLCTTAMASIAYSTNRMLCGTVHGFEGRDVEVGKDFYYTDPTHGTHCWSRTRPGPSPSFYYF